MSRKPISFLFNMQVDFGSVQEDELLAWHSGLLFLLELLLEEDRPEKADHQVPGPDQEPALESSCLPLGRAASHVPAKVRPLQPPNQ